MNDCDICEWLDTLDLKTEDMKAPTPEDRAYFAAIADSPEWVVDVHGETVDVRTVEAAADRISERLEN